MDSVLNYEKMAGSEERSSLWRTPLSTPVRTDENGIQDVFRHSEKLLASAVSICRLKGSVECQTGGIITVCEEMQRLLRLCFSENARVEKEMKKQKLNYDEEISFLKERVSYLEEKESLKKQLSLSSDEQQRSFPISTSANILKELPKHGGILIKGKTNGLKSQDAGKPKDVEPKLAAVDPARNVEEESRKENLKPDEENNCKKNKVEVVLEKLVIESSSKDVDENSLEVYCLERPEASETKGPLNKVGKGTMKDKDNKNKGSALNENDKEQKDVECAVDSDDYIISKPRRGLRKSVSGADKRKVESFNESPGELSRNIHLNPDTGLFETIEVEEEPLDTSAQVTPIRPRKGKTTEKTRKVPKCFKKNLKHNSKESKPKTKKQKISNEEENLEFTSNLDQEDVKFVGQFQGSNPGSCQGSLESEGSVTDNQLKETELTNSKAKAPEREEVLGDIGFLIDISSMITTFMNNPETAELELPLMSAKERADARKLAALFYLHISIGNKIENRSTLFLSKTPHSKMPKPGKLDNVLSQLSVAAAKEAEKAILKTRNKRKQASVADACNEKGSWDDSQPKLNGKIASRSKKARLNTL